MALFGFKSSKEVEEEKRMAAEGVAPDELYVVIESLRIKTHI